VLVNRASDQELVEWRPGVLTRMLAGGLLGSERLCLLEQWHEPGRGAPTHRHANAEELLLVLEGTSEVWVDQEHAGVEAGSTVIIRRDVPHGFRNAGAGSLHILAVFSEAEPLVEYLEGEGTVLAIGSPGGVRRDPHRALRG
jgi:quercetin dioxygenase-like cupin family protein